MEKLIKICWAFLAVGLGMSLILDSLPNDSSMVFLGLLAVIFGASLAVRTLKGNT